MTDRRDRVVMRHFDEVLKSAEPKHDLAPIARLMWEEFGKDEVGQELRVKWLVMAGWEPAGWSMMEWARQPKELTKDLVRVVHEFSISIVQDRKDQTG